MQEEVLAFSSLSGHTDHAVSGPVQNVFNSLGPVNINAVIFTLKDHFSWAWLLLPQVTNNSDHVVYVT